VFFLDRLVLSFLQDFWLRRRVVSDWQGHQSDVVVLQTTPSKKSFLLALKQQQQRLDKRFLITTFHYFFFHRFLHLKDCQNIPSFNMLMMGHSCTHAQ